MDNTSLLTMEHLAAYAKAITTDVDLILKHYRTNTIAEYYRSSIDMIILAMMMVPVNRIKQQLDPTEESDLISDVIENIAGDLAIACSKPLSDVHNDLIEAAKAFPTSDMRQSLEIRQANRLN